MKVMQEAFAAVLMVAASFAAAGCGPKTGALADGSKSPEGPRVASGAVFNPRVGDFASIERLPIAQGRISEASSIMVSTVLPRIRDRGGLRQVMVLRNDTASRFEIVSIWADPVQFQQWQMSQDRVDAYQALGGVLTAQPTAEPVSLIGLIDRATAR